MKKLANVWCLVCKEKSAEQVDINIAENRNSVYVTMKCSRCLSSFDMIYVFEGYKQLE